MPAKKQKPTVITDQDLEPMVPGDSTRPHGVGYPGENLALQSGQTIGRYQIVEQLGAGGMANVYKALDTRLERFVALKVIHTAYSRSQQFLQRFEREAKSVAALAHPNIVGVIDYGHHEGLPYMVMEYIPGGTLKEHLGEPIPYRQAVCLLAPIARALEAAHQEKIVHRDVKPSNILITRSGQPMLSDFGVAKILEVQAGKGLTEVGMGLGTPEYMSPEQGLGEKVDHRADVYALGVVLYEMVTGRLPYTADTPVAILVKQASQPLPNPRAIVKDLPDSVLILILKALAKDPGQRYQSMGEFAMALEEVCRGQAVVVPVAPVKAKPKKLPKQKTVRQTKEKPSRRHLWLWLIPILLIPFLAVAGLWIYKTTTRGDNGHTIVTPTITPAIPMAMTQIREKDGMVEVFVPAGEFFMGTDDPGNNYDDARPKHVVFLDGYWIDQHEVTNAQYSQCVAEGGCSQQGTFRSSTRENYYEDAQFANHPVIYVSWSQALAYCWWAGSRLPTEAQWEKAARGTDGRSYPWGEAQPSENLVNFKDISGDTVAVCSFPDGNSPYGVCDMAGNVWEWVNDRYDAGYYAASPYENPTGPASGEQMIFRGGGWHLSTGGVHTFFRGSNTSSEGGEQIGFRCARFTDQDASASTTQTSSASPTITVTPIVLSPRTRALDSMTEFYIPAGEFQMGADPAQSLADDDMPLHIVFLDGYWIDRHEITNAQYKLCVDAGICREIPSYSSAIRSPYYGSAGYVDYPVINVSWDRANTYCEWVGGRLPTEAEWEKAARGTDGRIYPWGDAPASHGYTNYMSTDTLPYCSLPNGNSPYGLCDMAGNVAEWVNDWYEREYYNQSPYANPPGPIVGTGDIKAYRGGSWRNDDTHLLVFARSGISTSIVANDIGFRCVRPVE